MNQLKIGIRPESLGLPLRRALREVQRRGVTGVCREGGPPWQEGKGEYGDGRGKYPRR
jgi:hypothetical protein